MSYLELHDQAIAAISEREWQGLERRCAVLAKSTLVPEHYRGKPADLTAASLGLLDLRMPANLATLSQTFVVKGRPGYMAQLQITLARRAGWFIRYDEKECDDRSATVHIRHPVELPEETAVTFTMENAVKAGLPNQNPTYGAYPDRMLLARAVTKAIGFYCPHVKLGIDRSADVAQVSYAEHVAGGDGQDDDTADGEMVDTPSAPAAAEDIEDAVIVEPASDDARRAFARRFRNVPDDRRPAVEAALRDASIPPPKSDQLTADQAARALQAIELADEAAAGEEPF